MPLFLQILVVGDIWTFLGLKTQNKYYKIIYNEMCIKINLIDCDFSDS